MFNDSWHNPNRRLEKGTVGCSARRMREAQRYTPDPERLSQLRAEFQKDPLYELAVEDLRQLAAKGCDPTVILAYVGRVAGYKSGNIGPRIYKHPKAKEIARRIRAISGQLKQFANRTKKLREMWGLFGRMVDANCFHVPEELCDIAKRLSRVQTKGFGDWNPQREALLDLLDHVHSSTGRYHYAEVSALINAELVWRALKHEQPPPELRHDVDSLRMIVQRAKKQKQAEDARRRSFKPKTLVHP